MHRLSALFALIAAVGHAQVGPTPDLGTDKVPPLQLTGLVQEDGKPVEGATVRLAYRKYPLGNGVSSLATQLVELTAKTDDKGAFKIATPPWRKCTVYAIKGERVSQVMDGVATPTAPMTLDLGRGWTLRGQLRYRRRAPKGKLAFRLVRVSDKEDSPPVRLEGTTDDKGQFTVPNAPPGPWRLMLAACDYRIRQPVTIDKADATVQVKLGRAIHLQCQVFDGGSGGPLKDATVELLDPSHYYSTKTGADGKFALRGVAEAPGASLLIHSATCERDIHVLEPGLSPRRPAPHAVITVGRGSKVSGTVTDAQGKGIPGLEVLLRCNVHVSGLTSHDLSVVTKTDAAGGFVADTLETSAVFSAIAMLPNGEFQEFAPVMPIRENEPPRVLPPFRIGSRRLEASLQLPEGGPYDYEMRIYGPMGAVDVTGYRSFARLPNGKWLSPSCRPGQYVVLAVSKNLGISRREIEIEEMRAGRMSLSMQLELAQPRKLEGVVVDAQNKPLEGTAVVAKPHHGDVGPATQWGNAIITQVLDELFPEKEYPRTVSTDKSGKFALWCFEGAGRWDLEARPGSTFEGPEDTSARLDLVLQQKGPFRMVLK